MNIEDIKTLTELMVDNDMTEIMIRDGQTRIVLRRGPQPGAHPMGGPPVYVTSSHVSAPPAPGTAASSAAPAAPAEAASAPSNLLSVVSPMVGTYYASPDPDSAPFIKVGDTVGKDTVVCIIEAMKVFNEIKAEVAGTVESIELANGQPVEFGQVLMRVRPK